MYVSDRLKLLGSHRMPTRVGEILRVIRRGFAVFLILPLLGLSAVAQEVSPEARAKLRALFEEVIRDPSNLDLTYRYAQEATKAGDYEAAVTAYERLLLFNPDLPRIKAELGLLYYRLGSYDISREYLEQALSEGNPPPETRQRVEKVLSQIEEALSPHRFGGSIAFGARYQTNGNFGPDDDILVLDTLVNPNGDTQAQDDLNFFAAINGRYAYDLGNDAGDYLFARGALYLSRQIEATELDVEHFRLKFGPGFRLYPPENGALLVEPHARLTYVRLDNESFNYAYGAGLDIRFQAFEDITLFSESFYEAREYSVTGERPNADTQDGSAVRFVNGATYAINEDVFVRGEAVLGEVYADADSESYKEFGAGVTVGYRIESPLLGSETFDFAVSPWNLSLSGRYSNRNYDQANPIVSSTAREDNEFRVDGTVAVPVSQTWSVFTTLGYQDNGSNLPNNDFENFSATIGANLRF